jgi:WD40-like Beta Propeller Repeat
MPYRFLKNIVALLFFILLSYKGFSQPYEAKNQKDFKAKAEKYFEDEDYNESYKAYSQLVANFPKDPIYNYRLGVSMLFAEPDKSKAKKYLDFAAQYKNEVPKEYLFYLAKYYHYNYEFDQAIKLYDNYKLVAKKSDADKLKVDNEIKACESGKNLLNKISDLTVLDKKELPRSDFFLSYDFNNLGGRLIAKPAEFKSDRDLKKKDNSVAFISTNTDKLFISNYNTDKSRGKDIYVVKKRGNGWGTPQNISTINTELDEDFPFLHPNGRTLYFASKGHNTMGGYDIFKSEYNESNDTWGAPVNLDFPINTPLDDILFATDSTEKYAYFASNRSSEGNNFTIYKINTQKKAPELISIQGLSVKLKPTESSKSVLTVVNKANGEVFGPITATDDGKYLLQIANGGKFEFTVETPGFRSQSQEVQLKQYEDVRPVLQFITYNEGQLSIKTYLDTTGANNYARMLEIIKQRSNLNIDTNRAAEPPPLATIEPEKVDATKVITKPIENIKPAVISEQQIIFKQCL